MTALTPLTDAERDWALSYFNTVPDDKTSPVDFYADDVAWHGACPFDELDTSSDVAGQFWGPLAKALPDLERRPDIFITGKDDEANWAASTGYFCGRFEKPFLDFAPTHQAIYLRYGEFIEFKNGRIVAVYLLLDLIDFARQAGRKLVPDAFGVESLPPGPQTHDGIITAPQDPMVSKASLDLVNAMIDGLMEYDGETLESMHQTDFWHPQMMWYGPSGIGTARGLKLFQDNHQRPFLQFVPDRRGGFHFTRIADGMYVASGGWKSINATTSGADWVGKPTPKGRAITMRVMDFWRRDSNLLRENWVFVDIPDVFRQLGMDLFKYVRSP